jgi:hypothetical protein
VGAVVAVALGRTTLVDVGVTTGACVGVALWLGIATSVGVKNNL